MQNTNLSLPPANWSINSWKSKPIFQQPTYNDQAALQAAVERVRLLPNLVHPNEVRQLREQLAEVATGRRFLLQGGDCAERFMDCTSAKIESKIKILLQMSLVLTWGARIPTVKLGRIAGQYGKPRSSPIETLPSGEIVNSFKGDNVNGFQQDKDSREHDPSRLVDAHFYSAATLNYIRAIIKGGLADLHNLSQWDLNAVKSTLRRERYEAITNRISDSLDFMNSIGIDTKTEQVKQVDFFSSHEGLILDYEAACTSITPTGEAYDLSAHFLWIGERTRQLDGAHIEFFRGLANPIGVKVGPNMKPDELVAMLEALNPHHEVGKLTIITRFGAKNVTKVLPPLVEAVQRAGLGNIVIWACDPMHGNTYAVDGGLKTRAFDDILDELRTTFKTHCDMNSFLGGIHFELTGEHVTECVGGPEELEPADLKRQYTTYCDPRLNYSQSLSMSFCLADLLRKLRERGGKMFEPKKYNHSPLLSASSSVSNLAQLALEEEEEFLLDGENPFHAPTGSLSLTELRCSEEESPDLSAKLIKFSSNSRRASPKRNIESLPY